MTNETEVEVTQADCKEIAAAALLAACEGDPADPAHPDTICITTGDLETIVRSAVENWRDTRIASRATDTALVEELRALTANPPPNLDGMGLWLIRNQSRILAVLEGKRT